MRSRRWGTTLPHTLRFNPNQQRDRYGRWGKAGPGGARYHTVEATLASEPVAKAIAAGKTSAAKFDVGDLGLAAIQEAQGFNGAMLSGTVDEVIANGGMELFRGDTEPEMAVQLMSGEFHAGLGIHGNGTYATATRATAERYGKAHTRIGLSKDARMVTSRQLQQMVEQFTTDMAAQMRDARRQPDADAQIAKLTAYRKLMSDPGRLAAASGYDVIQAPDREFVILNRGAVAIEEIP